MERLRSEKDEIMSCHLKRRTQRAHKSARNWWGKFCLVSDMPEVLDVDYRQKANVLLVRDVVTCFMQFVRENQRVHDKERGVGHHETPGRYCAPLLRDHDELGIDLRVHVAAVIKQYTNGLGEWQLQHYGPRRKRNKRPYSMAMMLDMFKLNWSEWCDDDPELETEVKGGFQVAVGVGFRKSEFLESDEPFNFNVHLTKDHVRYYEDDWQPVTPTTANIRRLMNEGGWALLRTANLKQDRLQEKWGNFPLPFRIGPEMEGKLLAPGFWLAMKELYNPIPDREDRRRLPLFMHPRKHQWLKASLYKRVLVHVLKQIHMDKGTPLSTAEIDELFGIHSARVTQQVLLAGVDGPTHVRKLMGRYSSVAFEDYDRMELERIHLYLKKMNEASGDTLQSLPIDMPCYPSMRTASPGEEYELAPDEVIVDPLHQSGNARLLTAQVLSADKTNSLVGRRVRKWFQELGSFYDGTITKVDEYYCVTYDDGDNEDLSLDELVEILRPQGGATN